VAVGPIIARPILRSACAELARRTATSTSFERGVDLQTAAERAFFAGAVVQFPGRVVASRVDGNLDHSPAR
jgi:hypothetical protein